MVQMNGLTRVVLWKLLARNLRKEQESLRMLVKMLSIGVSDAGA